jgi:lysozyme family protein
MKQTYSEAINKVFEDEGGYSNDAADPGGPTNWGITIYDARMYWKSDATASDVKNMPKSVAEEIYKKHYAIPLSYDSLPAGVDYAILDYGINSGINRSAIVLQRIVGVTPDAKIGPSTIGAVCSRRQEDVINAIYDERLRFLRSLSTWSTFGKGWGRRCKEGRALALSLAQKYPYKPSPTGPSVVAGTAVIAGTTAAVSSPHHVWPWIVAATVIVLIGTFFYFRNKYYVKSIVDQSK